MLADSEIYNYLCRRNNKNTNDMKKIFSFAAMALVVMGASAQTAAQEGALNTAFKVSDTKSVYFAKGNLQFNAMEGTHATADGTAKGTWRIAENQYDFIGADNENIAETYNGYVDLFAYGTSGWNSGATSYQPWCISNDYTEFYIGGKITNNLTGKYANADWGVYNAISNAGNQPGMWRTLTEAEWAYLFVNHKWTMAYIGGKFGMLMFPTAFTAPAGIEIAYIWNADGATAPNEFDMDTYQNNKFTTEQFAALEAAGVLFFPAAGYRVSDNAIVIPNMLGMYQSTDYDPEDDSGVLGLGVGTSTANPASPGPRNSGRSVRLVQDASSTGVADITTGRVRAHKVIRNGQMLIERNGKYYTATGVEVK